MPQSVSELFAESGVGDQIPGNRIEVLACNPRTHRSYGPHGGPSGGQDASPPLSIGKWQQARYLDGQQAQSVVNTMHPTPVTPTTSWVGYYGGGIGITIYASKFASPAEAQSALDGMRAGIAKENSGFSEPTTRVVAKQNGFHTEGVNKQHFFFVRNSWLIWIEGKDSDFEPTVQSIRWARPSKS